MPCQHNAAFETLSSFHTHKKLSISVPRLAYAHDRVATETHMTDTAGYVSWGVMYRASTACLCCTLKYIMKPFCEGTESHGAHNQ